MNIKQNESGRSMVEMLGVLAVIGVLSVMGIAGYSTAMKKHYANELLNEASKRAVSVAGQVGFVSNVPSLSEFVNNNTGHGTFETKVYGANGTSDWTTSDKQFTISITGVSEAVCNQMKNSAGDVIKGFKPDTCVDGNGNNVKLTYNNDMSTVDLPAQLTAQDPVSCSSDAQCNSNEECSGGICRLKCPAGTFRGASNHYGTEESNCYKATEEKLIACGWQSCEETCPAGYVFKSSELGPTTGLCCPQGSIGDEEGASSGIYCYAEQAYCTNGTWSSSGSAYCVNGQWKTQKDFSCGDTNNPWSCTKRNKYACDAFGQNCTCFNGGEYRGGWCSGGGSSGY